ncbi:MAG TPA: trimeric intracellular cation channel family protein [Nannocystaceae bacterium]|nr:trimeric intracellular cation channel family protein [Nannocystaceae bacterium]
MNSATLLLRALDLVGTFVFAVSGAALGVRRGLDLFGVLVLGLVTAVAGGIMRDVLIGAVPPAALASWWPMALAVVAGLFAFRFDRVLDRLRHPVQFFDAAGLGLFAVAGTQKALAHELEWPMAVVLGMISGIGGGIVRDVLTAQVPTLLRSEIYAVAALAGGLVVVGGAAMHIDSTAVALLGITVCVTLRLLALYRGWKLPVAAPRE